MTSFCKEEFDEMMLKLAPFHNWGEESINAWTSDLMRDAETTMACLRALNKALKAGRGGYLIPSDWN